MITAIQKVLCVLEVFAKGGNQKSEGEKQGKWNKSEKSNKDGKIKEQRKG
jgi:hypothetical protein